MDGLELSTITRAQGPPPGEGVLQGLCICQERNKKRRRFVTLSPNGRVRRVKRWDQGENYKNHKMLEGNKNKEGQNVKRGLERGRSCLNMIALEGSDKGPKQMGAVVAGLVQKHCPAGWEVPRAEQIISSLYFTG